MKKSSTTFPEVIGQMDQVVEIATQKPLGLTAQVYVHEIARKLPLYNEKINCKAKGQDKEGNKIEINNVGRWLFGVPGFAGHSRIAPSDSGVLFYFSKKSPKVVHDLVSQIKQAMEESN